MRILVIVVILVVLLAMWLYGRAVVDELDSLPGDDLGSWDD